MRGVRRVTGYGVPVTSTTHSVAQLTVSLHQADLDALAEAVRLAARAEREWVEERRAAHRGLRGAELAAARQELRAERERERAAGRLAGTRDLVVARALRAELEARHLGGQWSAPRPGAIGPGRRWGSTAARYQHLDTATRFDAQLSLRLPVDLADQLRHGVYWQSSAIEHRLQLLAGRAEHRAEIARLQADLVTTGDVLRAAVRQAAALPVPAVIRAGRASRGEDPTEAASTARSSGGPAAP